MSQIALPLFLSVVFLLSKYFLISLVQNIFQFTCFEEKKILKTNWENKPGSNVNTAMASYGWFDVKETQFVIRGKQDWEVEESL